MATIRYMGKQWEGTVLEVKGREIYVDNQLVHTIKEIKHGLGVRVVGDVEELTVQNTAQIQGLVEVAQAGNTIGVTGGILEVAQANNRVTTEKIVPTKLVIKLSKEAISAQRKRERASKQYKAELDKSMQGVFDIKPMDLRLKRHNNTYINVWGDMQAVKCDNCCEVKGNVCKVIACNYIKIVGIVKKATARNCIQSNIIASDAVTGSVRQTG